MKPMTGRRSCQFSYLLKEKMKEHARQGNTVIFSKYTCLRSCRKIMRTKLSSLSTHWKDSLLYWQIWKLQRLSILKKKALGRCFLRGQTDMTTILFTLSKLLFKSNYKLDLRLEKRKAII